ncbi:hypothetical protein MIND_01247700 [Mycena indigotica]|uniref:DUF6534 domain-containing protein n=1 Tax=Mycena indigotica TaxID=2126181 RepID=A0A8H6S3G1_9AGAR|nr:uncharacterized protein MIND_01247700 [Mycena indigotica]KAF7292204.1 hypothetical protein MIND_01247700 [Mycena indigotica]
MHDMLTPSKQTYLAPALCGTWVNFMLYMLELVLAWQYYTGRRLCAPGATTPLVRWLVGLQVTVDTLGTVFAAATVYLLLVVHWGDLPYLAQTPWSIALYCITTGVSAFLEQIYLIWRYFILSKNYFVCVLILLEATASLGASFAIAVLTFMQPIAANRGRAMPLTLVWFITGAIADVAIALALVMQLRRYKSPYKQTQHIVRRLIVSAIQTGCVTALVTIFALIGFAVWPHTAVSLAFGFFLGRVYGCTLLYNLVSPRPEAGGADVSQSAPVSSGRERRATVLETFGGIHVHQIVQITKDADVDMKRFPAPTSPVTDVDELTEGDDVSTRVCGVRNSKDSDI